MGITRPVHERPANSKHVTQLVNAPSLEMARPEQAIRPRTIHDVASLSAFQRSLSHAALARNEARPAGVGPVEESVIEQLLKGAGLEGHAWRSALIDGGGLLNRHHVVTLDDGERVVVRE